MKNNEMVKLQNLTLIFIKLCSNYLWASCAFICLWFWPFIHVILLVTSIFTSNFTVNQIQQHTKTHDKMRNNWGTITIQPTCRPLMKFSTEKSWYRKMSRSSWKTLDPNLNGYREVISIWSRKNIYFKVLAKNFKKFKLPGICFYFRALNLRFKWQHLT